MNEKELDLEVRRWLDHTLAQGAYTEGVIIALKSLYHRGRTDVQEEIKNALNLYE